MAETSVRVPSRAGEHFEVYVNGVRQKEGPDFTRRGDQLIFARSLEHEGRLGFWRWLSLFLGVAGTYRKNDSVDIVYEVNGRRTVETGLPMLQSAPMGSEEQCPGDPDACPPDRNRTARSPPPSSSTGGTS